MIRLTDFKDFKDYVVGIYITKAQRPRDIKKVKDKARNALIMEI